MNDLDKKNKIKISLLDFTNNNELPSVFIKILNNNEEATRIKYNSYISRLSEKNIHNKFTLFNRSVIRNTYKSNLFIYFCYIEAITSLIVQGYKIEEIITDKKPLYKLIMQIIKNTNTSTKLIYKRKPRLIFFLIVKNIVISTYSTLSIFFFVRFFFKKIKKIKDAVYIDTFITKNNLDKKNCFNEIFYKDLSLFLPTADLTSFFYAPIFYGIKSPFLLFRLFRSLKLSSYQFLFPELYLNFFEIIHILFLSIITPLKLRNYPKWNNLDVSSIILEENLKDLGENSYVQSLLIYYSFKKYKKNNFSFRLVIDLFENQNVDRALYLGLNENFPNVKNKGYLGFIPEDYYAGLFPTEYEFINNLSPKILVTTGSAINKKIDKYSKKITLEVGPAFRFNKIHKFNANLNLNKKTILLCLPIHIKESEEIIKLAYETDLDKSYVFKIKTHPAISANQLKKLIPIANDSKFLFTNKDLYEIFIETNTIITSASSTCLEAILCGIKVAIIGSKNHLTKSNLNGLKIKDGWKICYNSIELKELIKEKSINRNYKTKDFFNLVNVETVSKFVN